MGATRLQVITICKPSMAAAKLQSERNILFSSFALTRPSHLLAMKGRAVISFYEEETPLSLTGRVCIGLL